MYLIQASCINEQNEKMLLEFKSKSKRVKVWQKHIKLKEKLLILSYIIRRL